MWDSVKSFATRRQYWFQQDEASCHVAAECFEFLQSKFGESIISRRRAYHWPLYSPDLSPLDFSFQSQVTAHVIRFEPSTIAELKAVVEGFAVSMSEEEVWKMVRNKKKRAEVCRNNFEIYFEHLLKKRYKQPNIGYPLIVLSY